MPLPRMIVISDNGCTTTITHEIPTGDNPPILERNKMIPPKLYPEVRDQGQVCT